MHKMIKGDGGTGCLGDGGSAGIGDGGGGCIGDGGSNGLSGGDGGSSNIFPDGEAIGDGGTTI